MFYTSWVNNKLNISNENTYRAHCVGLILLIFYYPDLEEVLIRL